MAIRSTMTALVGRLRSDTGAATNDLFFGQTFWSDEQLQTELDRKATLAWDIPMTYIGQGRYAFTIPRGYEIEPVFTFRDEDGNALIAPTYTAVVGADSVVITLSGGSGSTLTAEANLIDYNQAAASVWGQKASHRHDYVDIKAGDHRFAAEQEYKHCVQMHDKFRGRKARSFSRNRAGYTPSTTNRSRRW